MAIINDRSLERRLKDFARAGFLIGLVMMIFLLVNAFFTGEVGVTYGGKTLSTIWGIVVITVFLPLSTTLTGLLLGLINYAVTTLIRSILPKRSE